MWASIRAEQQEVHRQPEGDWMPVLDIARFAATYPGVDLYRGWTATRDGAIPSRLFFSLYRALPHVRAGQVLEQVRAVMQALNVSLAGEEDGLRRLLADAYPETADGH